MTDDDPSTAETDAIVAELERAGLITVTTRCLPFPRGRGTRLMSI